MSASPTQQVYDELQQAYEFFNTELFDGRLPACVITLQRQHDTFGYFSANQFQSRTGDRAHEIALNPSYFAVRTIPETLSVLVREMVSLDQTLNTKRGKLPRRRYRNTEWADMCEAIGLMPSSTGKPGGKRTGDNVQTYVVDGGAFDLACSRLVDEAFTLSWVDRFPPKTLPGPDVDEGDERPDSTEDSRDGGSASMDALNDDPGAFSLADLAEDSNEPMIAFEGASADHEPLVARHEEGQPESMAAPGKPEPDVQPTSDAAPPMKQFERINPDELSKLGLEPRESVKNASKTAFKCVTCGAKAWGKPSLQLGCFGSPDSPHEPLRMAAVQNQRP